MCLFHFLSHLHIRFSPQWKLTLDYISRVCLFLRVRKLIPTIRSRFPLSYPTTSSFIAMQSSWLPSRWIHLFEFFIDVRQLQGFAFTFLLSFRAASKEKSLVAKWLIYFIKSSQIFSNIHIMSSDNWGSSRSYLLIFGLGDQDHWPCGITNKVYSVIIAKHSSLLNFSSKRKKCGLWQETAVHIII